MDSSERKKKRERRKKCRGKPWKVEDGELSTMKREAQWKAPTATDIVHKHMRLPYNRLQLVNLKQSNRTMVCYELIGQNCSDFLLKRKPEYVRQVEQFASQLIRNFKRFRVRKALNDHVPSYTQLPPSELVKRPITAGQFRAFFSKALRLVIPPELLGDENFAQLQRNLCKRLFDLRRRDAVAVFEEIADGIRYEKIGWMRGIPFRYQDLIMRNFCRYVFEFSMNALSYCLYVTVNSNGDPAFYRRDVWQAIEKHGFESLTLERQLQPLNADGVEDAPLHRLRFHTKPSSGGLRPIVTYREKKAARALIPVKAVLDLVMDENKHRLGMGMGSLKTFHAKYRQMVLSDKKSPTTSERYWCSADLSNCFTTMRHETLDEILTSLIPSDKTYTIVSAWCRNRIAKRNYQRHAAGYSFSGAQARIWAKRYEDIDIVGGITKISGAEVLALIRKHAIRTAISYCNRLFLCRRGIPQGNPLSVKLCNLYLGAMELSLFPQRPKNVTCVRYVDDYFLTSTDKQQITEVAERLFQGCPKFGTQFNDKARTSFPCKGLPASSLLKNNEKLRFCGYAVNRKTLSISVDYDRYRNKHPANVPPRSLQDPTEARHLICNTVKRLIIARYRELRRCYQVFREVRRRRQLRHRFNRFVAEFYLRHFAKEMQLRWTDPTTRGFFQEVLRWVGQNFRVRAAPTTLPKLAVDKKSA